MGNETFHEHDTPLHDWFSCWQNVCRIEYKLCRLQCYMSDRLESFTAEFKLPQLNFSSLLFFIWPIFIPTHSYVFSCFQGNWFGGEKNKNVKRNNKISLAIYCVSQFFVLKIKHERRRKEKYYFRIKEKFLLLLFLEIGNFVNKFSVILLPLFSSLSTFVVPFLFLSPLSLSLSLLFFSFFFCKFIHFDISYFLSFFPSYVYFMCMNGLGFRTNFRYIPNTKKKPKAHKNNWGHVVRKKSYIGMLPHFLPHK